MSRSRRFARAGTAPNLQTFSGRRREAFQCPVPWWGHKLMRGLNRLGGIMQNFIKLLICAGAVAALTAWWVRPAPIPPQSTFTIVDPNGRTCEVSPDPKGRKPLAAILGCPETVREASAPPTLH
jgi:hypothetical protein